MSLLAGGILLATINQHLFYLRLELTPGAHRRCFVSKLRFHAPGDSDNKPVMPAASNHFFIDASNRLVRMPDFSIAGEGSSQFRISIFVMLRTVQTNNNSYPSNPERS